MNLLTREARPDDAAAIVGILNPIVEARTFTVLDTPFSVALQTYLKQGFRVVGRAHRHARLDGRYIDEIVIEKILRHV